MKVPDWQVATNNKGTMVYIRHVCFLYPIGYFMTEEDTCKLCGAVPGDLAQTVATLRSLVSDV